MVQATIRPFLPAEERCLIKLRAVGTSYLDVTRDRPTNYDRLADRGLATIVSRHRQKRARLTAAGRYFADLLAARGDLS